MMKQRGHEVFFNGSQKIAFLMGTILFKRINPLMKNLTTPNAYLLVVVGNLIYKAWLYVCKACIKASRPLITVCFSLIAIGMIGKGWFESVANLPRSYQFLVNSSV